ncbi:16S rRNA (guanine(966)-N(2))-methyltransferase RsmD [Lachnospiraceae bacterium NSJ-143]|nr:16S rRNA (guanine(966)-N(2))-methyltransferase RsmD [Lachnospiraceae bacterium NSJ-143]
MRVISGTARGSRLKSPEGVSTRPTTDRIKESLFNIVAPDLYDCRFLDLFSGSGSIAIEALSRGACEAVLVDNSPHALEIIKENLEHTKLDKKAEVIKTDAVSALKQLSSAQRKFDIIFMDPPYASGLYSDVLETVVKLGILDKYGIIIAEQSSKEEIINIKGLVNYRVKDYKTTKMAFYALEDNND